LEKLMKWQLKSALGIAALVLATQAMAAQITFYEGEGFRGRAFTTSRQVGDFQRYGFNDRASSVVVDSGRWEVCEDASYDGRCVVLRPGSYDSLRGMGVNNRVSSVRQVSNRRHYTNEGPAPLAAPSYDYRRRSNERVYEANVTSVHAVVGPQDQRCWVDREQVDDHNRGGPSAGGAVIGAVIGGILGHQIGSGRGRDAATVGGAVVGGVVGANVGRDSGTRDDRDVRRCETIASSEPDYWDVTYDYRDVEHRVQMTAPPGRTILVNRDGEPRQ
jgi:uncharacterized protein YcfJ